MKNVVAVLAMLVWSLWFGGIIALFISVQSLFNHNGVVARSAAPILFSTFDFYQLILCVLGLLCAVALVPLTRSSRPYIVAFLFCLCGVAAITIHVHFIPVMDAIRAQAQATGEPLSHYPQFGKLHGQSMMVFTSEAVLLLISGVILPGTIFGPRKR